MFFSFVSSFAQEKASSTVIQKVAHVDPIGRLTDWRVFIGPDGEVHVWCVCIAPYDEWCLTSHSGIIQQELLMQSSSRKTGSKKSKLSNVNLSDFEATLLSSNKNQKVFILSKKK